MVTDAWNPALRAKTCDQKRQNSLALNYRLNHVLYTESFFNLFNSSNLIQSNQCVVKNDYHHNFWNKTV